MIAFYRTNNCPGCQSIEDALVEMAIACKVYCWPDDEGRAPAPPEGKRPPLLVDDDQVFEGHGAIAKHVDELEDYVALWQKFQSDACYCDDDGDVT